MPPRSASPRIPDSLSEAILAFSEVILAFIVHKIDALAYLVTHALLSITNFFLSNFFFSAPLKNERELVRFLDSGIERSVDGVYHCYMSLMAVSMLVLVFWTPGYLLGFGVGDFLRWYGVLGRGKESRDSDEEEEETHFYNSWWRYFYSNPATNVVEKDYSGRIRPRTTFFSPSYFRSITSLTYILPIFLLIASPYPIQLKQFLLESFVRPIWEGAIRYSERNIYWLVILYFGVLLGFLLLVNLPSVIIPYIPSLAKTKIQTNPPS